MKSKEEIVANWLPRYTGVAIEKFGKYILLTNFQHYIDLFAQKFEVPVDGEDCNMPSATANDITILNFGMGSPNAATIMDLLSATTPKAALFLGKCGGLKIKNKVGDLILPIAAIRHDGTSDDYLPPKYLPCLHLTCNGPFLHPFAIIAVIIILVSYSQLTKGFGNTTPVSKNTSKKQGQWLSTWKLLPCSSLVLPIKYQLALCCWFQINP